MTNATLAQWVLNTLDDLGPTDIEWMTNYVFTRQREFTRDEVRVIVRTVATQTSDLY